MVTARAEDVDVRASAVRAAMRLFAAHGFDGTALQDVADAVGVTKPVGAPPLPLEGGAARGGARGSFGALEGRAAAAAAGRDARARIASTPCSRRAPPLLRRGAGSRARGAARGARSPARRRARCCVARCGRGWSWWPATSGRAGRRAATTRTADAEAYVLHVLGASSRRARVAPTCSRRRSPGRARAALRPRARPNRASELSLFLPGRRRAATKRTREVMRWPASSRTTRTCASTSTRASTGPRSRR